MQAQIIRVFEDVTANGVSTFRRLSRVVDVVTLPRRGDRLLLPDLADSFAVERAVIIAAFPDRAPAASGPRAIVTLAPETVASMAQAASLGWKAV